MTATTIRLKDADGAVYKWTLRHVPKLYNMLLGQSRVISGWEYTDHEGYTRFSEGIWEDAVADVKLTASNYGLTVTSDLTANRFDGKVDS